jgi:hypothetical protein
MDLVFEAKGPVLLDRATGKKIIPLFNEVQFTFSAEGPVLPDITPEIQTFLKFPCPIYILVEKQILMVMMLLYRPDSTSPIYAYADNKLWEIKKRGLP